MRASLLTIRGDNQGFIGLIPIILMLVGIVIGIILRIFLFGELTGVILAIGVIGLAFMLGLMAVFVKSGIVDALLIGTIIGLLVTGLVGIGG